MRFLPLIWSGLWRKPGRTVLIFLQVTVAFALFGVLQGLKTAVAHAVAAARADLLLVHSRVGFLTDPLPLGLLDQIKSIPGVKVAVPVDLSGATYQKPTEKVGIVAVGTDDNDWPEAFTYTIAPGPLAALHASRAAMLAQDAEADKYGWKTGDRVPLMTITTQQSGSSNWAFDDVGTFTDSDMGGGEFKILINYAYFDEARVANKGTVNHFNVAVSDPKLAVQVADAIDRRFRNSSHETKTDSLRELAQRAMQSIGDFDFLIRAVVSAVLVALLFATTTMMIQSVRERTPELAVLKTVGFSDRAVYLLVLAEALVVCIAAAACGLALATLVFPYTERFVVGLAMPGVVVALGLGCSVLVALVSAAVPAALAARVRVATALAGR
jgi:putative ABC transport system permease protein